MKKVYQITQWMDFGIVSIYEHTITKETAKTITYDGYRKNKTLFNKVHLYYKDNYIGRNQFAYVHVVAESKLEAMEISANIFKEWERSLIAGIDKELVTLRNEQVKTKKEGDENVSGMFS